MERPRPRKRVFKKLTIRLSLFEFRSADELRNEMCTKTLSKAIIKASCNYIKLKLIINDLQNQIDILNYEKSRQ